MSSSYGSDSLPDECELEYVKEEVSLLLDTLKTAFDEYNVCVWMNGRLNPKVEIQTEVEDCVKAAIIGYLDCSFDDAWSLSHIHLTYDDFRREVWSRRRVIQDAINRIRANFPPPLEIDNVTEDEDAIVLVNDIVQLEDITFKEPENSSVAEMRDFPAPVLEISPQRHMDINVASTATKEEEEDWVFFNVNGEIFQTMKYTVMHNCPGNMLARLVCSNIPSVKDETGAYVLDADPAYFREILNYLRRFHFSCRPFRLRGLRAEADYFRLDGMVAEIDALLQNL